MLPFSPETLWIILGLLLIGIEILTLTFILLFFGISALLVAMFVKIQGHHLAIELFLFAVISLLSLFLFRKKVRISFHAKNNFSTDTHQIITLSAPIEAHGKASIFYQGSLWTAQNVSALKMEKGERVRIEKVDSIQLFVQKISST